MGQSKFTCKLNNVQLKHPGYEQTFSFSNTVFFS